MPAGQGERRLALAVVLASAAIFIAAVPFAKTPLAPVWAFIPVYQSALVVNDLITAVLLFGQFAILRSRALLVLGSAYLFTALMAGIHALTFPGLFAPAGLLGAGPQTTAWLCMFWHGGFPLLVIAYALLEDRDGEAGRPRGRARAAALSAVAAACVAAGAVTLLATAGQNVLPPIMQGGAVALEIAQELRRTAPDRRAEITIAEGLTDEGAIFCFTTRPPSREASRAAMTG